MVDYNDMTDGEFDRILFNLLEKADWYVLIKIPGVYEAVAEYFNNDVLDIWAEEQS